MRRFAPFLWVLGASIIAMALNATGALNAVEWRVRDRLMLTRGAGQWPADLVLFTIDDRAIAVNGPWPWSWTALGALLTRLDELGASTIAIDAPVPRMKEGETTATWSRALRRTIVPAMLEPGPRPAWQAATLHDSLLKVPGAGAHSLIEVPSSGLFLPGDEVVRGALGLAAGFDPSPDFDAMRFVPAMYGFADDDGVLPSLALAAFALQRGAPLAAARITTDRLELPGLPSIPLVAGAIPLDLGPPDDVPPRVTWTELESGDETDLRARLSGKLVVVTEDNGYTIDRVVLGGSTQPVTHGLETAVAIRTLAFGRVPRRPPGSAAMRLLTLLTLLVVLLPIRLRPVAIAIVGVTSLLAAAAVTWLLASTTGVILPICNMTAWTLLVGGALVLQASRHVEHHLRRAESRADAAKAPKGRIALVFTDVQGSTRLWDRHPDAMRASLELHDRTMRAAIEKHGGYEVKTEGDAFMIAFPDAVAALKLCLEVQRALPGLDWPAAIVSSAEGGETRSPEGALLFRGLRVRMGIHTGEPECVPDPKTGRMDYFGPVVNRAARVSSAASGGQIVVSADAWREIQERRAEAGAFHSRDLGEKTLKGIETPERLTEILPEDLAVRSFAT